MSNSIPINVQLYESLNFWLFLKYFEILLWLLIILININSKFHVIVGFDRFGIPSRLPCEIKYSLKCWILVRSTIYLRYCKMRVGPESPIDGRQANSEESRVLSLKNSCWTKELLCRESLRFKQNYLYFSDIRQTGR